MKIENGGEVILKRNVKSATKKENPLTFQLGFEFSFDARIPKACSETVWKTLEYIWFGNLTE